MEFNEKAAITIGMFIVFSIMLGALDEQAHKHKLEIMQFKCEKQEK